MSQKITLICILMFLMSLFISGQNSNIPIRPDMNESDLLSLQKRKLELEIAELENKKPTWFVEILNSPLALTSLTLIVGGLIFGLLSENRAKQAKKIEKSIEFVEEVSRDINSNITMLARYIRLGNFNKDDRKSAKEKQDTQEERARLFVELQKSITDLYKKRMSVAVKSKVFLGTGKFSKRYDWLILEISKVTGAANKPSGEGDLIKFDQDSEKLKIYYGIENDEIKLKPHIKEPFRKFDYRVEILWLISVTFIHSEIETLFISKLEKFKRWLKRQ